MRLEREQRPALGLGKHLVCRRDLVANDGVKGDFLGELDRFAEHDDGDRVRAGEHGHDGRADARVQSAVGHHGVRAEKDLGRVLYGVRGARDEVVAHGDAMVRELAGEFLALEERLRVDDDDGEGGAGLVGLEERLLDDGRGGVGQDHVAGLDLGDALVADQLLGGGDALADEHVDFF